MLIVPITNLLKRLISITVLPTAQLDMERCEIQGGLALISHMYGNQEKCAETFLTHLLPNSFCNWHPVRFFTILCGLQKAYDQANYNSYN